PQARQLVPRFQESPMPAFRAIVPVLKVADLPRAVEFYTAVLGFSVAWRAVNDGGGGNALLPAGGGSLLLATGTHLGARPQFTGSLYFDVDGVQELFDRVREKAEIVWPLETIDDRREFGIRDPDGYVLAFAETGEDD